MVPDLQYNYSPLRSLQQQAARPTRQVPNPQQAALSQVLGQGPAPAPPPSSASGPINSAPMAGATAGPAGAGDPNSQVPGYGAIQSAYRTYLGREPGPDEVQQHLGPNTPGWSHIQHTINTIAGSPEAKLYSQQQKALKGATSPAGAGQPQMPAGPMNGSGIPTPDWNPTPTPIGATTPIPSYGDPRPGPAQPPNQPSAPAGPVMPGWDATKWADPNKHDAKYDAGHLMQQLGAPTPDHLNQVAQMLQKEGHQVSWDGGDGLTVDGVTIDAIKGLHSNNPEWAWNAVGGAPGINPAITQYASQFAGNLLPAGTPLDALGPILQQLQQQVALQGTVGAPQRPQQ